MRFSMRRSILVFGGVVLVAVLLLNLRLSANNGLESVWQMAKEMRSADHWALLKTPPPSVVLSKKENMVGVPHVVSQPNTSSSGTLYEVKPVPDDITSLSNASSVVSSLPLWPHHNAGDRIIEQLNYSPKEKPNPEKLKLIYVQTGLKFWNVPSGRLLFQQQKCRVDTCDLTEHKNPGANADAILFRNYFSSSSISSQHRPSNQVWIWYQLECPYHSQWLGGFGNVFNWTATYRHDSDIVTPYERFELYDSKARTLPQNRNYAEGKTKMVAWFVSNCGSRNDRLKYANELGKHVLVDIYGSCGSLSCPRSQHKQCNKMLNKQYKFYLSFENSNCRDYITEKFFDTGLRNDIVPIVMGAKKEDYTRAAPYHSFIHVDDFAGPKELGAYLKKLDANDDLYNEYFQWKGTGRFINTYFWCRLCAMLHTDVHKSYEDINTWWRGKGTCVTGNWADGHADEMDEFVN